jgi:hypothetical protein
MTRRRTYTPEEKRKRKTEYMRMLRFGNPDYYRSKDHNYYIANREEILAKQAAYREANKSVLMRKRYFRYYRDKGWSDEDIERIIRKKLEEQSK